MIRSRSGFYIGDVENVLSKNDFNNWVDGNYNDINGDNVQEVEIPRTDNAFGVVCELDNGVYEDQYNHEYIVKSGCIGVVPVELCDRKKLSNNNGLFVADSGEASIELKSNMIVVKINDDKIYIDKADEEQSLRYGDEDFDDEDFDDEESLMESDYYDEDFDEEEYDPFDEEEYFKDEPDIIDEYDEVGY